MAHAVPAASVADLQRIPELANGVWIFRDRKNFRSKGPAVGRTSANHLNPPRACK
jgi:hypothetical protein